MKKEEGESFFYLREKARMPRALLGDEWLVGVWGHSPQLKIAFSFEEAPAFGRGSSRRTRVVYDGLKHWIPAKETVSQSEKTCHSGRAMLFIARSGIQKPGTRSERVGSEHSEEKQSHNKNFWIPARARFTGLGRDDEL